VARLSAIEAYDLLVFFPLLSSSIIKVGLVVHPPYIFHYEGEFFIILFFIIIVGDGESGFESDHLFFVVPSLSLPFSPFHVS